MEFFDLIKETSLSTGTGPLILAGAVTEEGFRAFSPLYSIGDRVPYGIRIGAQWELGKGTLTAPDTLERTTVTASSNNGQLVNFSAGTKEVWCNLSAAALAEFLTEATLAELGTPLPDFLAANPATEIAPGDMFPLAKGTDTLGASASTLATFVLARYSTARTTAVKITTATTIPLDSSTHHRRRLICSAAATLTGPTSYASVGDDFECEVVNISGGTVTFGTGINCVPAGNTLENGASARVFSTGGSIYALLPAAGAASGTAPGQVTGLQVGSATASALTATWAAPSTGTAPFSYTVQYRVTGASTWITAATGVNALTYQITGLTAATGYEVHVAASNSAGTGTYSSTVTGTTAAASGGGGGGTAPFTVTTRAGFPLTRGPYSSNGVGSLWAFDIVPTGTTTPVSLELYVVDSNSLTPAPNTSAATTPKGAMDSSPAAFQETGHGSYGLSIPYNIPTPTNYYFWAKLVDSNGDTWWFRRDTAIEYWDNSTNQITNTVDPMVQVSA